MSYEAFKAKVNGILCKVGNGIVARFSFDDDKGRFFAHCSDGTVIVGHSSGLRVTVRWGSGHVAMASL